MIWGILKMIVGKSKTMLKSYEYIKIYRIINKCLKLH